MSYDSLNDFISAVEYGTKLHISIVFFSNFGNIKTRLPYYRTIHKTPICDAAKNTADGLSKCMQCKNTVLKKSIVKKKSFYGLCVKGVFEYCRPVIFNNSAVAVIFIGNILTDSKRQIDLLNQNFDYSLIKTMQTDFSETDCVRTADILEAYLIYLFEKYHASEKDRFDPLVENIINYIEENFTYSFSMTELSAIFNYNEKYLGRLFKKRTGYTVKEYCNLRKIEKAKYMLTNESASIIDISSRVGYNNTTYFNRIFKTTTGLSPKEYRKEHQKVLSQ